MRIRPAHRRDAAAIASLHAASWRAAYQGLVPARKLGPALDGDRQRRWKAALTRMRARDVVLVAEDGKKLIGFVAVWMSARHSYIDNLHVQPDPRGRGIGERLMREAARQLIRQGCRRACLWVFVANRPAVRFYERLGGIGDRRSFSEFPPARSPCQRMTWRRLERLAA